MLAWVGRRRPGQRAVVESAHWDTSTKRPQLLLGGGGLATPLPRKPERRAQALRNLESQQTGLGKQRVEAAIRWKLLRRTYISPRDLAAVAVPMPVSVVRRFYPLNGRREGEQPRLRNRKAY